MHYNSIFISDIHLGAAYSQTEKALYFLKNNSAENLFLLGDIFDDHQDLQADWYAASELIVTIFNNYSRIVYVPGNHDPFARHFHGLNLPTNLEILLHVKYPAKNGKIYLLIHGDEFDWVKEKFPYLFGLISNINHYIRTRLLRLVSIKREAKIGSGVNHWINNILMNTNFYNKLTSYAAKSQVDGIICGHFHEACIDKRPNLEYINCGDWIDSCTAIVETTEGTIKLVKLVKLSEWK